MTPCIFCLIQADLLLDPSRTLVIESLDELSGVTHKFDWPSQLLHGFLNGYRLTLLLHLQNC